MNLVLFHRVNSYVLWSLENKLLLKRGKRHECTVLLLQIFNHELFMALFISDSSIYSGLIFLFIMFAIRKQGASAGDRVYGLLFILNPNGDGTLLNLAVESVRNGHAVPKITLDDNSTDVSIVEEDPVLVYEKALHMAFLEAKLKNIGIHSLNALVRNIKSAGDDFQVLELVEKSSKLCDGGALSCVIEHIFDGSKLRVLVTDSSMAKAGLQYAYFTLIVAGITSPRMGNPRSDPPLESEPLAEESREFVESRLLQRELKIMLYGLDKPGLCAVGSPLHPRGNIAVELLKNGLARMCDWSSRLMNPLDLPAMRVAENSAKVSITPIYQLSYMNLNLSMHELLLLHTHDVLFQ